MVLRAASVVTNEQAPRGETAQMVLRGLRAGAKSVELSNEVIISRRLDAALAQSDQCENKEKLASDSNSRMASKIIDSRRNKEASSNCFVVVLGLIPLYSFIFYNFFNRL